MKYSFEKLEVWQKSRELVKDIYKTTDSFPDKERFGLSNQIQRAIISVSSNIAEGSNRQSCKDKARFYEIAYGSLIEVLTQLVLAMDLKYVNETDYKNLRSKITRTSWLLNKLYKSTLKQTP